MVFLDKQVDAPETDSAFYSVQVDLEGRMMREDFSEQKCKVERMSPAAASFICASQPVVGEKIISYIDQLGRLEGIVSNITSDSFEVIINATPRKQTKLAAQLTWLANKHELQGIEDRKHAREYVEDQNSEIRLEDGRTYPCRIIDLSVSGAAFEVGIRPEIGTTIWLGSMKGSVVRHFETGVSMQFASVQQKAEASQ